MLALHYATLKMSYNFQVFLLLLFFCAFLFEKPKHQCKFITEL
jgi:hypothetical protein